MLANNNIYKSMEPGDKNNWDMGDIVSPKPNIIDLKKSPMNNQLPALWSIINSVRGSGMESP